MPSRTIDAEMCILINVSIYIYKGVPRHDDRIQMWTGLTSFEKYSSHHHHYHYSFTFFIRVWLMFLRRQ